MAVPNIFGSATAAIPLSQLDTNFATAITLSNTAVYLGNTTTSLGNVTLTNVTISSGNVSVTGANVSGTANISTLVTTNDATIQGITVGRGAGAVSTNTAVGASALAANQAGGTNNTAIGNAALDANTTGDANTAVGDDALGASTTASNNTAVGYRAGYSITTGSKNTIIGGYTGNQGGLDIRTASNYIVLSDGDGNPRLWSDSSGNWYVTGSSGFWGSGSQFIVSAGNGGFYQFDGTNYYLVTTAGGGTSDATLKKNVKTLEGALDKVCAIRGVNFEFIDEPLSAPDKGVQVGVIAQEVEAQFPETVVTSSDGIKSVRYDRLVAPLIEAIKELKSELDSVKAELATLKG